MNRSPGPGPRPARDTTAEHTDPRGDRLVPVGDRSPSGVGRARARRPPPPPAAFMFEFTSHLENSDAEGLVAPYRSRPRELPLSWASTVLRSPPGARRFFRPPRLCFFPRSEPCSLEQTKKLISGVTAWREFNFKPRRRRFEFQLFT